MAIPSGKCRRWNRRLCTEALISALVSGFSCTGPRLACWSLCLRKYCKMCICILIVIFWCKKGWQYHQSVMEDRGWPGNELERGKGGLACRWRTPAHLGLCLRYGDREPQVCVFFQIIDCSHFVPLATSPSMTWLWLKGLARMWEASIFAVRFHSVYLVLIPSFQNIIPFIHISWCIIF